MKKKMSLLLALLLLFSTAAFAAEVPQISENLFVAAKQALTYLSSGEYERLVTLLPFSDVSPSAAEWRGFAEGNFTSFTGEMTQTDYAVAYWSGAAWKLAVPVSEPSEDSVETLVLTSTDGVSFSGYGFTTWAEAKGEFLFAPYVIWNKEYIENAPVIAAD